MITVTVQHTAAMTLRGNVNKLSTIDIYENSDLHGRTGLLIGCEGSCIFTQTNKDNFFQITKLTIMSVETIKRLMAIQGWEVS